MIDDPTDWNSVLAAVRPFFEDLIDTQRQPLLRPVLTDPHSREVVDLRGRAKMPDDGQSNDEVLSNLFRRIFDDGYCNGAHPQYFGYFHSRSLPIAVLGDCIAALLNQSPAAWRVGPSAAQIEIEVLSWLADFIGYSKTRSDIPAGIFTVGGTSANIAAIKMARDKIFGSDVITSGTSDAKHGTVYASAEIHYSIGRALDITGLGRNALRIVPTDNHGRLSIDDLKRMIVADLEDGYRPIAAIGLAGATATGSIDNLDLIADICKEHNMWFHIDGAAASVFADIPEWRCYFRGLNRADSITLDPHKWMFVPYGLGCLLVREPLQLHHSFGDNAHYWKRDVRPDFVFLGPDGARPWKSLGLWLAMSQLGKSGYFRLLQANHAVAVYLSKKIDAADDFENLMDPVVPICCFRAIPTRPGDRADEYNERLYQELMLSGNFFVTLCYPKGETYFRVAINNYTTKQEHIDRLVLSLLDARSKIDGNYSPPCG